MAKRSTYEKRKRYIVSMMRQRRSVLRVSPETEVHSDPSDLDHIKIILDKLIDDTCIEWSMIRKTSKKRKREESAGSATHGNATKRLKVFDDRTEEDEVPDEGAAAARPAEQHDANANNGDDANAETKASSIEEKIVALEIIRDQLLGRLKKLKESNALIASQISAELIVELRAMIKKLQVAANRWTSNVLKMKAWYKDKGVIDTTLLDKLFQIPANFDYL